MAVRPVLALDFRKPIGYEPHVQPAQRVKEFTQNRCPTSAGQMMTPDGKTRLGVMSSASLFPEDRFRSDVPWRACGCPRTVLPTFPILLIAAASKAIVNRTVYGYMNDAGSISCGHES